MTSAEKFQQQANYDADQHVQLRGGRGMALMSIATGADGFNLAMKTAPGILAYLPNRSTHTIRYVPDAQVQTQVIPWAHQHEFTQKGEEASDADVLCVIRHNDNKEYDAAFQTKLRWATLTTVSLTQEGWDIVFRYSRIAQVLRLVEATLDITQTKDGVQGLGLKASIDAQLHAQRERDVHNSSKRSKQDSTTTTEEVEGRGPKTKRARRL